MNGQSEPANKETDAAEELPEDSPETEEAVEEVEEAGEQDPLEVLQAQAETNWDSYLRVAAELENVRKRAQRDVESARKFALERFSAEMLSVLDSLELGLAAGENTDAEQLRAGTEATLKLLTSTLERFGVKELDPLGEPFDPQMHEAMMMQPSADVEPGSVITVFQKGFTLNGRLLRPARVVVSQEPAELDE